MDRAEEPGPMSVEHAGLRRRVAALLRPEHAARAEEPPSDVDESLRARVERLETMVESLQDALYRQAQAQDKRDQEVQRRLRPEEMARALSTDERRRGL